MPKSRRSSRRSGAVAVGAGILLSRIAGLLRERVIGYYLGLSPAAGAFRAALRIPNLLQNLLGEGVLSASLIPVYTRLIAEGRHEEASRVARAIATLLALAASAVALAGVAFAQPLVDLLAPGFDPATRGLTIQLVRILFPGVALLVLSAWCLGVLNSHRKFFLSYASPVIWNIAIIAAAVASARWISSTDENIALWLAYGAVVGSGAQFLVQLPTAIAILRSARPVIDLRTPGVQSTLRSFGPVVLARGSVQLSGYIDQVIASYLGPALVAALANAQTLYLLPVSLFGMAISASELPEMSSATGDREQHIRHVHHRLVPALRRVVFFVVPSAVGFVAIGGSMIGLLFETGRFGADDTNVVWIALAGSAIGLVAGTTGRLLASAFYALGETKPPLAAALVRVACTAAAGWAFALPVRHQLGYSVEWGAFGLTASAGAAAWIEFWFLRRWLVARIGTVEMPTRLSLAAFAAAALAGTGGFLLGRGLNQLAQPTWLCSAAAIGAFGLVYVGILAAAKVSEARAVVGLIIRRRNPSSQ